MSHRHHTWVPIPDTTPSGKALFFCTSCGRETPAPTNGPCGFCSVCRNGLGTIGHALACHPLETRCIMAGIPSVDADVMRRELEPDEVDPAGPYVPVAPLDAPEVWP